MRKIAVVTGTRAEYGLLYWIIKGIHDDSKLKLQLLVTCMHLSRDYGLTVREIERDGFPIAARVRMLFPSDTERSIAMSMGKGMIGFAKAYEHLRPDLIVVLGDRFEILSAVASALPFRIPVAHIHGGEATEGLIDEAIRHAVTKMSHIHFVATQRYRKRVIQMGESPKSVFCVGAPGLDNLYKLNMMEREKLFKELGLPEDKRIGLCTYHPVTLERNAAAYQIRKILKAIRNFKEIYWIFTLPNADTEGKVIIEEIDKFVRKFPSKGKIFASLGQMRYLSLLKNASLMLGNSSSGLIEAPSLKLPAVNIGERQRGRIRGKNVIDVKKCERRDIVNAIDRALSSDFRRSLEEIDNPYGNGGASEKIVKKLKSVLLGEDLLKKKFYEEFK